MERSAVAFHLPLLALLLASLPVIAQTDVLTNHNDDARSGANTHETILTPANVNQQHFGMLFKHVVDDQVYSQPLIATGLKVNGGTHDIVFITTVGNSVYAFDANDATAAKPIWQVNFGTPANLNSADFGCLDMNGNMGIIGTPVINPEKTALYVVALTKSGDRYEQRLHALDLTTGADLPNSPATIQATGFDPLMQNQRPALFLARGNVYIGYASHCDKQPYHGFLLSYDAATLKQSAVFNTSPDGEGASIWQSGQAPAVDADGNIYLVTGNGSWNGTTQWSESFLKLDPKLNVLDWFTPTNHFDLDAKDDDLDSSGATLVPGKGAGTQLVLGGGKRGVLYALDTNHLGHLGDGHAIQHFQATGSHLHSIVYWRSARAGDLLYIWGQRDRARVYKLDDGRITETPAQSRSERNEGHPGAMLSLSANQQKDGILWAAIHATGDSWHESRPGILHAYLADDISHELWNSLQNATRDNCNNYSKMAPPTIANGKVYLSSFGTANIGTGQLCVYGLLATGEPPAPPRNAHAVANGTGIVLAWDAVPGAITYAVASAGARLAAGLTTPGLVTYAAATGTISYTVTAINQNGQSLPSTPATVTVGKAPMPRVMH